MLKERRIDGWTEDGCKAAIAGCRAQILRWENQRIDLSMSINWAMAELEAHTYRLAQFETAEKEEVE